MNGSDHDQDERPRHVRAKGVFSWLLTIVMASSAHAVSVRTWAPSSAEEFRKGTLEGTALDERGHVRLGPSFENLWGPEPGVVWGVAPHGKGAAFVALSGPARVLRVEAGVMPATWYESADEGLLVTALARASRGGIYWGLSPQGGVFQATRPDRREKIVDTGSRFVWALAVDADGALWIGTGEPGRLLKRPAGKGEAATVFESGEDPVRSLAALPGGGVVAGTGQQGKVIRFDGQGRPFVLLDAEQQEIVSLTVAADGTVFALAAGGGAPGRPDARARPVAVGDSITVRAKAPEDGDSGEEGAERPAEPAPPQPRAARRGGALYRLDRDGSVRVIWRTDDEEPYAVAVRGEQLLVGTGPRGRVYGLDREGRGDALLRFPSDRPSALAVADDGRVLVGGTSDARVAVVGPGPADSGTYLSEPIDAGTIADWGRVRWQATVVGDGRLEIEVRAGNTQRPDSTWSAWARPAAGDGEKRRVAAVPAARWLQVRATLGPSRDGRSPVLHRVEVTYLPRNRSPEITRLEVQPVGVAWTVGPMPSQTRGGPHVVDDPVARRSTRSLSPRPLVPRINRAYEAGARTFDWEAEDPDGDDLRYRLEIRREEEQAQWFPLADAIEEAFFSWDSRAMPDGLYRVRLTADDGPDNPADKRLTSQRVSEPFRVDNTPPRLVDFATRSLADAVEVRFTAQDPGGRIEAVEYALDGRNWRSLDPLDGVADSEEERYVFELDRSALAGASHHLVLRVTDTSGNLGGDMRRLK